MKNPEYLNNKTISLVEGEKVENNQKQPEALFEDYFFDFEEKFVNKDFKKLAKLQKNNMFNRKSWTRDNEITRCKLMKKLVIYLLGKNEKEVESFWSKKENEYMVYYGRSREKEKESKTSFETLKHGILNEIIANKILGKLSDFQFSMTNPEIDIDYKIDIIGVSNDNKIILSIQVKQGSRYQKEKTLTVQEINKPEINDKTKNEFLKGCSRLKDELNLDGKDIILKNIWITIPAREKIGEGGKYSHNLQDTIIQDIKKILELKN